MKRLTVALVALCIVVPACGAQARHGMNGTCPAQLKIILRKNAGKDSLELRQFLSFKGGMDCMASLLLTQATAKDILIDRAETIRAALQQNGTSAGGGNTTSLVSKGMTAQVLAIASEYGAMTQSTSGQTVTVSGCWEDFPRR